MHHDQFDMWDSKYQPWNSTRLGPKRDLIGEWEEAARKAGIRFGLTFLMSIPGDGRQLFKVIQKVIRKEYHTTET